MMNKTYGYGIVDRDGKPHFDEFCVSEGTEELQESVDGMNESLFENCPYRVVELFYMEDE
jgi:hypothetical protein